LLLSRAFWWESLLRWDLGFHGAFGYQGASFSKHFILFFSLGYHRALLRIFLSHGGIQAKTEPFLQIFLSLNGTQAITEPFSRTFLSLNGTEAVTEPCHGIILSLWDFGYHGAFSWNHSFTLGFRYRGAFSWNHSSLWDCGYHGAFSWNHSFTLGFRLSWSLLMESFFHFCIS
jgi:hypothetical protein